MKSLLRKSFGLGAVLALLAGPALAQPYYGGSPAYGAPHYESGWWRHERHEAMWRAYEQHDARWHATDGFAYAHGDDHHPSSY